MNPMKKIILFLLVLGIAALFYFYDPVDWVKRQWFSFRKLDTQEFVLKTGKEEIKLELEVADSAEERTQGLMYRRKLDDGKGMWFVFEDEQPRAFWMKDTEIPLDIIFFNQQKQAVSLVENMEPCLKPEDAKDGWPSMCKRYDSKKKAMYALEMNAGFVDEKGVKVGDLVISQ